MQNAQKPLAVDSFYADTFARDDLIYKWKPVQHPITIGQDATVPAEFAFDTVTSNYCDAQSGIGVIMQCLITTYLISNITF